MGLADFEPFRQNVKYRGEIVLSVRGLSLDDVSILVRGHMDDINRLVDLAREKGDFGTVSFLTDALVTAPKVLFDMIALAADEPTYSEDSRKLPVGLQIKILQDVLMLTLEDIGGPKALVALVQKIVGDRKLLPGQQAT